MADYTTLDIESQSWANIQVASLLQGGPTVDCDGIVSVGWDNGSEVGTERRTDGSIRAFTRGQATPSGKIAFYAGGCLKFIKALMTLAKAQGLVRDGKAQYGLVRFDLLIHHTPIGETGIRTVKVLGCRLKKDAADHSEGTDADKNELELIVSDVVRVIDGEEGVLL
jgi:hypothetical protein